MTYLTYLWEGARELVSLRTKLDRCCVRCRYGYSVSATSIVVYAILYAFGCTCTVYRTALKVGPVIREYSLRIWRMPPGRCVVYNT